MAGGGKSAGDSAPIIQSCIRWTTHISASNWPKKGPRLWLWCSILGSGIGGGLSRMPGKSISSGFTRTLVVDVVQVIGVDISPQLKPDETPENFEPQVCSITSQGFYIYVEILTYIAIDPSR